MTTLLLFLLLEAAPAPTCFDAVGIAGPTVNGEFTRDRHRLREFTTILCVNTAAPRLTFSITLPLKDGAKKLMESPDLSELGEPSTEFVELASPIGRDGIRWKIKQWRGVSRLTACKFDVLGQEQVCAFVGLAEPKSGRTTASR
jgi:hypothetical protein